MSKVKDLSYEEAMKELEDILDTLEEGEGTLDSSMEKFKRGVDLYKHCNELLTKKEGEIKVLLEEDEEIEQNFLEGVDEDSFK